MLPILFPRAVKFVLAATRWLDEKLALLLGLLLTCGSWADAERLTWRSVRGIGPDAAGLRRVCSSQDLRLRCSRR